MHKVNANHQIAHALLPCTWNKTEMQNIRFDLFLYMASVATRPGTDPLRLVNWLDLTSLKSVCAISPS